MLTDCVWLIEVKILSIFWEKCQGGSVDIYTIFKNQHTYWARIFWQALQFSCCSPETVMGKTLSWQLQAGGISLAFRANNYWARMFWQGFQFSCCSPELVVGMTLSWQLQAVALVLVFLRLQQSSSECQSL